MRSNADHIRAMGDEELSVFLNEIVINHHLKKENECRYCPLSAAKPCDEESIICWLRQPAEKFKTLLVCHEGRLR